MHRFMVEPENIQNGSVRITGEDVKHLRQVLRLKAGDAVSLFDGSGLEYEAELTAVEKEFAAARILSARTSDTEPRIRLTLFQGIPKAEKMDWIIQKAVELGIYRIVPVITMNTVVQLDPKDREKKRERWSRIAKEAAKQCKRAYVPEVDLPVDLETLCHQGETYDAWILLYENEQKKCLKEQLKCYNINKIGNIALFVGPEGGFSDSDLEILASLNTVSCSLGKRVLRTETAAVCGISIIMYEMGEMQ